MTTTAELCVKRAGPLVMPETSPPIEPASSPLVVVTTDASVRTAAPETFTLREQVLGLAIAMLTLHG